MLIVDRYRTSIQYWRSGFTNLITTEFDCAWIDEPSSILVGVVRNLHTGSNTFHLSNLGIPTCQLQVGIRSHNPTNEKEYRYSYENTLFRLVHQSHDYCFVVYGKEYGRLGGRYGDYRYYTITSFLWNWYPLKGRSLSPGHSWKLTGIGRFPFFPLVNRLPRYGRYRSWKGYSFIGSP